MKKIKKIKLKKGKKTIFKGILIPDKKGKGGHIAGTCDSDDIGSILEMITGKKLK